MKKISIVGHANTGKSTLFNKIVGKRKSIVGDIEGITRDRIVEKVNYNDKEFYLIDTGGITSSNLPIDKQIKAQSELAINESDEIIFLVDGVIGLTNEDQIVAKILRQSKKKVIVAINKIDNKETNNNIYDFYSLGFDTILQLSAIHNNGIYELLDEITKDIEKSKKEEKETTKIAIIGRPNVGKSSIVNSLLNSDRLLVSDIAGTTRDSINTKIKVNNKDYILIDTAGLRKKRKIYEDIEKYSYIRTIQSIEESDICILVIDAKEKVKEHDKHIAGYAIENGKGLIILSNKQDLIDTPIDKQLEVLKEEFKFADYAKFVFTSAKTKKRINTIFDAVEIVENNIKREIKTSILNKIIQDATQRHIPPSYKTKRLKIFFVSQTGTKPPKYTFRVNDKGLVHFSYERYLENELRKNIELEGTPIIIQFKNRSEEDDYR